MTERPNNKAVEAAAYRLYVDDPGSDGTWEDSWCREYYKEKAEPAIEAAAPYIIEQFIDGLTEQQIWALRKSVSSEFRRQLKRLIPK